MTYTRIVRLAAYAGISLPALLDIEADLEKITPGYTTMICGEWVKATTCNRYSIIAMDGPLFSDPCVAALKLMERCVCREILTR